MYTFPISVMVFDIIKQKGVNTLDNTVHTFYNLLSLVTANSMAARKILVFITGGFVVTAFAG
jgi:hypothetical protein